jgi:hypothetical protein
VLTPSDFSDLTDCIETANKPQTKRKFIMTRTTPNPTFANNANTDTQKVVLPTLELEGADIARLYLLEVGHDSKRLTRNTKPVVGLDTRLGNEMRTLKAEFEGGRIPTWRLRECQMHIVDKRRRSEALWFVENEVECREFIAKSKKGFTSLTALQSAMKKANKKKESSTDDKASTGKSSKASATPTEATSEAKPATKETIFKELLAICKASDVNIMDIAEMLMLEAEMLTPEELADEKKVA